MTICLLEQKEKKMILQSHTLKYETDHSDYVEDDVKIPPENRLR